MLIEYGDEPGMWHERLVIAPSTPEMMFRITGVESIEGPEVWWALTPDGDLYPQQLSVPPLRGLAFYDAGHLVMRATAIPAGVLDRHERREYHRFQPGRQVPCASPLAFLEAQAVVKQQEAPRVRLRGKQPAEGRGPVLPVAPALGGAPAVVVDEGLQLVATGRQRLPAAGSQHRWVVIRASQGGDTGYDVDEEVEEWAAVGRLGLVARKDGSSACVAALSESDVEQLLRSRSRAGKTPANEDDVDLDARVLAIQRLPDGRRHRPFRDAVAALVETSWDHWPVHGPRTLLWCARHIVENDQHPLAHHTRFKQNAGLQHHDAGVPVHETAMRMLEYALSYDQVQAAELACLEVAVRQAQLVELKYRDKVVGNQTGAQVSMLDQDDHLYLGTGSTRGQLMIDPRLEEYVAGELQREAAAAKERRKMREERGLQRPPPGDAKGGGKQK